MSDQPDRPDSSAASSAEALAAAIAPHRERIDAIDAQLLDLLSQRAAEARAIGTLKGTAAVYRPEREAQVLARIAALNAGPLHGNAVRRIFREIMSECLALERPLTVAYLGPQGTFTEQAAQRHFGGAAQLAPCATIDAALREVEARQADYAVVPVENSSEGAVNRTLDLLPATPLRACGEVTLRIHHCLMSPGEDSAALTHIYAHPQALAQCQDYLTRHLPAAERLPVSSNAEAARLAAESGQATVAALGPSAAASVYGLNVLEQNIEDDPSNTTRFLVLGHASPGPSGQDRTTLVVAAPQAEHAGAMHRLLEPFSRLGISMTKLESRPVRGGLWQYVFFIDIEGHAQDSSVAQALAEMQERATFLKVVGSYPRALS
ncbi:chorismate mutase [Deinococcus piscis]|uniref:Bifunctional chorismate mutase/prephenate dehydratase n=1 Tax=Deinococcus piscis TaxID=394230 RepID=A0ABQ3K992_9DEIO|nr:prephenate dehydratase [Deinococcus piscis]GHG08492.1 chorismate mutase [Deinococcus piscis]